MTQNREIEQRQEVIKKLAQAQDVIYDAWEASSQTLRVSLATRALAISPLCADAYVLLAEAATTIDERLQLYEKGVEVGEQALGAEIFKTNAGSFWGRLETRPYMRARAGFAHSLWEVGRQKEAIDHLEEMLELNPNDNQGNRFLLLQYFLTLDDVAATKALLKKHARDASTIWTYTKALLAYRDKAPDAEAIVKEAWRWNPYVPGVLSGSRSPVEPTIGGLTAGGPDDATYYVRFFGAFWRAAPGAIEWLTAITKDLPPPERFIGTFH